MNTRPIFLLCFLLFCIAYSILYVPLEFANDQEKYLNVIQEGNPSGSLTLLEHGGLKLIAMHTFSIIQLYFVKSIDFVKIINFTIFSFILFLYARECKYKNIFLIIFIPTVLLHATLFLREIYVYELMVLLFLTKSRLLFFTIFVLIGFLRFDSIIIITPLLIYREKLRYGGILYLLIIAASILFYQSEIYQSSLEGYLKLYEIKQPSVLDAVTNFYIPSAGHLFGYIFVAVELIFLTYFFYFNRSLMLLAAITVVGAIFLGSASDNIGFILRIRSPLLFGMFLYMMSSRKHAY